MNYQTDSIDIYFHRLIQPNIDAMSDMDISLITLRVGTKFGVTSHIFRVESKLDFDIWHRGIIQSLHDAVNTIKEIAFRKFVIVEMFDRLHSSLSFSLSMEQTFMQIMFTL